MAHSGEAMIRPTIVILLVLLDAFADSACAKEPAPGAGIAPSPFVMAMIRPEHDFLGRWWRLIYAEVFRRLEIPVRFEDYSSKRASLEADEGLVDGEPGRILDYQSAHPSLLRIEEPLLTLNFSAFVASAAIGPLNGWESLRDTAWRVEYQRGIRISENNLPGLVPPEKLSSVTEPIQGLRKLAAGRTDVYVDEESGILTALQTPEFKGSGIRVAGIMATGVIYPYVLRKHAALAPKMAAIIRSMKAEGAIVSYRWQVERELGVEKR